MSIISDITSSIKDALRMASTATDGVSKARRTSFARGANEQTFQFPCLVSNSAPVPMASTVVRHLDRMYATFVQIYLSGNGIIDLNYVKNPRQFINQFQSQFQLESAEEEDDFQIEMEDYMESCRAGNSFFTDENGKVLLVFQEGTLTPGLIKKFNEGKYTIEDLYKTKPLVPIYEADDDIKNDILNAYIDSKKDGATLNGTMKLQAPRLSQLDVKKLNDMQPFVLELKLLATKGESGMAQYLNYNVGVKTTLHLAKSELLVQNLVYVLKNKNPMFNFIRWTTGELSLMKDIILNINDINFNIANKYDSTGKFITALKRMRKRPVTINRNGLSKNVPFATIVITSYEYNIIKNTYGFDLKNITFANKVMDELYLMCFCIMDESTQTIDILLDGSTTGFQSYSMDILEKETTLNSNKLGKELTRMLSQ